MKVFQDKQKLKQYMTTKDSSRNSVHRKMKANKTMKGQAVPNHRRRQDKESESTIDSAAHLNNKNN
jgi:GH15 family glucan-1,4-alpha-glucosidase